MKVRLIEYLTVAPIGAFVYWAFKGFKGDWNSIMNRENAQKNVFAGMLTIGLLALIIGTLKYYYF